MEARTRPSGSSRPGGVARRGVGADAVWALFGKVTGAVAGVGISVLVTRLLAPDAVGVYFILVSVVSAAALLSRVGLEKGVLQLVAHTPEAVGQGVPRGALVRVLGVVVPAWLLVAAVLLLFGRPIVGLLTPWPLDRTLLALLAVWAGVLAAEQLTAEAFRAGGLIPQASAFGGATSRTLTLIALGALLLAAPGAGLDVVVASTVAAVGLGLLVAVLMLGRRLVRTPNSELPGVGGVARLGIPLLISNAALFVAGTADIWILGAFRPDEEVALYGAALRLVSLVALFLGVANAILPPMLARLRARPRALERRTRIITSLAALPALPLLVGLIAAREPLLALVYGPFYAGAGGALAILCAAQAVNVWVGSCGYLLVVAGHQRALMWTAVGSGLVAIGGSVVAAPRAGVFGVAAAVATATTLHQLSMWYLARRLVGVRTEAGLRPLRVAWRLRRRLA